MGSEMCIRDRSKKNNRGSRGGKDNKGNTKPQFAKQATDETREAKNENQTQNNRGDPEIVQCNAARARTGLATPPLLL